MDKNLEAFVKLDKSKLKNKYVIIVAGNLVAKGKDIETMLKRVKKKYPDSIPLIAKVSGEEVVVV